MNPKDRTPKLAVDALRQAFMSKEDYECLRVKRTLCEWIQRPLAMVSLCFLWGSVLISMAVMLDIVFAITGQDYPFCQKKRLEQLAVKVDTQSFKDGKSKASLSFTEEEAAQYFWAVVFLPTWIVFSVAVIYLFAGMLVADSAPHRHWCLSVVENNCCASKRGGVRCLAILNLSFFAVLVLLSLVLGSSILTLKTDCSIPLFWCYEVFCWSLVLILGGTAYNLTQKAAIMDEGERARAQDSCVELLEARVDLPVRDVQEA